MAQRMAWASIVVALAGWLTGAAAWAASDKPKPSPDAPAKEAPAKEAPAVSGEPQLTTASFGDWVERCQRVASGKVCEVALTVTATNNGQNSPLAEIAIGRVKKGEPFRLTLVLPVNVSFPSAPRLNLEDHDPVDLTWRQCVPAGCFADAAFGADPLSAIRDTKTAKVESKTANGQAFNFAISLRGLPQALDALAKEP